jgi:steroid delta-isomerase-like uncharacterized protein
MAINTNKALVRRYFEELWSQGKLDVADEIISPDFTLTNPNLPQPVRGVEGVKQVVTRFRTAFPDLQVAVERLVAEEDTVVARNTARGTHHATFQNIPPTGKRIAYASIGIFEVAEGKIASVFVINDTLGLLQQLGTIQTIG